MRGGQNLQFLRITFSCLRQGSPTFTVYEISWKDKVALSDETGTSP